MKVLRIPVKTLDQIPTTLKRLGAILSEGVAVGTLWIQIGPESRSARQNRLFHKLIGEIAKQAKLDRIFNIKSWKALLVDEYEQELMRNGETLNKHSEIVISLDGRRAVTIRPSTTDFTVREANGFIDFLMCFGAEHGVRFSADGEIYKDELRRAA